MRPSHARVAVLLLAAVCARLPIAERMVRFPGHQWSWGGEMVSVANSIARGEGFGSPYGGSTGPTAQVPPVWPYYLAGVLKSCGGNTDTARIVVLLLNVLWSSLAVLPVLAIGDRIMPRAGPVCAWVWALMPLLGYSEVIYLWNTSLYTLVFTTLLWATLVLHGRMSYRLFAAYGMLVGASLLLDPAHLVLLVFLFTSLVAFRRANGKQMAAVAVAAVAVIAPWIVRNSLVFGRPTFVRSNVGYELYRGFATHPMDLNAVNKLNPGRSPIEWERYSRLGEHEYMRDETRKAKALATEHPDVIARHFAIRFVLFWAGHNLRAVYLRTSENLADHVLFAVPGLLGIYGLTMLIARGRDWFVVSILAATIAVFPVAYYFVLTMPRYRAPIEPILWTLGTCGVLQTIDSLQARRRGPLAKAGVPAP